MKNDDLIIRDCGLVGYLGIIIRNNAEIYRTGMHQKSEHAALTRMLDWLDQEKYSSR